MTTQASPTGQRKDLRVTADGQQQLAQVLCRRHAAALLTTALLLIDDTDQACDVVADSIAAACAIGTLIETTSDRALVTLVASVIRRCAPLLPAVEPAAVQAVASAFAPATRVRRLRPSGGGNVRQRFGNSPAADALRGSRTGNRWMQS